MENSKKRTFEQFKNDHSIQNPIPDHYALYKVTLNHGTRTTFDGASYERVMDTTNPHFVGYINSLRQKRRPRVLSIHGEGEGNFPHFILKENGYREYNLSQIIYEYRDDGLLTVSSENLYMIFSSRTEFPYFVARIS